MVPAVSMTRANSSSRVYRGPESPANSDHLLVATDLTNQLSRSKKTDNVRRPYDTSRLLQDSLLQQLQRCSTEQVQLSERCGKQRG